MSSNEPTSSDSDSRLSRSRSDEYSRLKSNENSSSTPSSPSFFLYSTEKNFGAEPVFFKVFDVESLPLDFANYTLIKKLGEGGAGIVFLAKPHPSCHLYKQHDSIALKMIRPENVASLRAVKRFEKESRLQSEIDSPFVTKHLHFGEDQGRYFIASEFAEGISLERVVDELAERSATVSLRIIADVLKALEAMHSAGLIHRDVKPANIIVNFENLRTREDGSELGEFLIAKLTDFGLARHIQQSESLALTNHQAMLGTPVYMAPEQHFGSRDVDARADIYSVGVTLYQLLAGHPPFTSDEKVELSEMHRVERPVPLTIARPGTSEGISNLIMKALEKDPNMRYQHAREMLADVERILSHQPLSLRMYPETPDAFHSAVKCYSFQWELDAGTKQLWPLVSDTDRFNKAMRLPAPRYSYDHSTDQLKIFADANYKGIKLRWLEHPFQWVCEREMSVLREFELGPFEWVTSTVELFPMTSQKTRLIHRFQVKPRGWFGKLFTPVQFGWLTKGSLNQVYRRLEVIANDTSCGFACDVPFGASPNLTASQLNCLEKRVELLGQQFGNVRLARAFGQYIQRVADPAAVRIRPFGLSSKLDCTNDQSLQICFAGVRAGLLNMSWDIICPVCRIAADNAGSLEKIQSHAHCKVCNIQFEAGLSQSVEAIFSVHPEIRKVDLKTYCVGGPYHAPHVLAQNRLLVNQHVDIGVALNSGTYEITGPQLGQQWEVAVNDDAAASRAEFVIGDAGDAEADLRQDIVAAAVRSGPACVTIDNQSDLEVLVRLEQASNKSESLTATVASQHPLFRELFPAEVITAQQLVGLSNVYLLAIRLTTADELLDEVGDLQVRDNWSRLQQMFPTEKAQCKIVECTYQSLVASFSLLDDLLATLLTVLVDDQSKSAVSMTECCFAICAGEVMIGVSANQPSTFGKTVRDTQKMVSESSVGELRLSNEVFQMVQQSRFWEVASRQSDGRRKLQSTERNEYSLCDFFTISDKTTKPLVKLSFQERS